MRARFRGVALAASVAAILVAVPSCASRRGATDERPATTLTVDNRSSFEMTIYVWRGAERIRLGTARPVSETRLPLPQGMIFGPTPLRFQADPIGSQRAPITSEILVSEGDNVELRIPPM